jgi:phosphinothricin acetyltransferase
MQALTSESVVVRPGRDADMPAVAAIYHHHVLNSTGTFEIDPPTLSDMLQRRAEVLARGLPYLVLCEADRVQGFAYCNWFKPRPAYRFSAEDSIYLAPQALGRGWGQLLLNHLCEAAELAGLRKLIAVIGDSANAASIGTHRRAGFEHVGLIRSCGWKFDRWLDIVLMEKTLGASDQVPPESFRPGASI